MGRVGSSRWGIPRRSILRDDYGAGFVDSEFADAGYVRRNYVLSPGIVRGLVAYYGVCIGAGLFLSIREATDGGDASAMMGSALAGSIGMALVGSGLGYVRRLYKASVSNRLSLETDRGSLTHRFGFSLYFAFRPIFSVAIAVLFVFSFRTGIDISASESVSLTTGFLFSTMVTSFFIGFSAGAVLTALDERGTVVAASAFPRRDDG